jgi:hypothetical protein
MPDIEKREWWYIRCESVLLITGLFAAAWLLTIRRLTSGRHDRTHP